MLREIPIFLPLLFGLAFTLPAQTTNAPTPAQEAALKFMRGINFGNALEYGPGEPAGNTTYALVDFSLARSEGFDHIRLPIAWHLYAGPAPEYALSPTIFGRVDTMVDRALSQGLSIILNVHHFHEFTGSPNATTNKFYAIWRQVASHYAARPQSVAFELLNEPNGAATTAIMNPIYTEAIRQIRVSNPNRTIFIGPGNFNNLDELRNLRPPLDNNLIATVHCYDPFLFTHQGAEWTGNDTATTGVLFPGPPGVPIVRHAKATNQWVVDWFRNYNTRSIISNPSSGVAFRSRMQNARAWSLSRNIPLHVGEFGAYQRADAQSRVNFYREIRRVMDEQGFGWAMWDWKAGFHYIRLSGNSGSPDPPGLREALFPTPQIAMPIAGMLEIQSAKGKTYIIEKATSLSSPFWQTVSTQTLLAPTLTYSDSAPAVSGEAFYRVKWLK